MAKNPVTPNFQDTDAAAVEAAQQLLSGARTKPLIPANDAQTSLHEASGVTYRRWSEPIVIGQAYRTVTKNGNIDVVLTVKVRQTETENEGARTFFHYYLNYAAETDGQKMSHDRGLGSIATLLKAVGFMPKDGTLRASILDKMFPQKNQPGASSPLNGKTVIANIVQTEGPRKDPKNKKLTLKDSSGKVIIDIQDKAESFAPDDDEVEEAPTPARSRSKSR